MFGDCVNLSPKSLLFLQNTEVRVSGVSPCTVQRGGVSLGCEQAEESICYLVFLL